MQRGSDGVFSIVDSLIPNAPYAEYGFKYGQYHAVPGVDSNGNNITVYSDYREAVVPCFEYYFDYPHSFETTFFIGATERFEYNFTGNLCVDNYFATEWIGAYGEELPHDWYFYKAIEDLNQSDSDLYFRIWGGAFPIVKLRCNAPTGLYMAGRGGEGVTFAWPRSGAAEYRLAVVPAGQPMDNAEVVVTTDTFYTFSDLVPDGHYELSLAKGCRYATAGYDTVVWSGWGVAQQYINAGVGEVTEGVDFDLAPNPARAEVTVVLRDEAAGAELTLCDLAGRCLWQETLQGLQTTLDVSVLPAGVYLVKVVSPQGLSTRRLLVER